MLDYEYNRDGRRTRMTGSGAVSGVDQRYVYASGPGLLDSIAQGAAVAGATREAALTNIREALQLYLERVEDDRPGDHDVLPRRLLRVPAHRHALKLKHARRPRSPTLRQAG